MVGRKPVLRAVSHRHKGREETCSKCACFNKCVDWTKSPPKVLSPTCCFNHDGNKSEVIFVEVHRE